MHDSLSPLGGGIALFNMLLGELVYGGLGTGLASLLFAALLTAFVAGLMTGRAPAYLGNAIGIGEIKLIALYALIAPLVILPFTALAVATDAGRAALATNSGAHGFTSIAFAYASSYANNGQSFAGLAANSPFYNYTTAATMLAGRFLLALPTLALAGAFAGQHRRSITRGSLPSESLTFGLLLMMMILILAGLSFLPMLCLGPIAEHLMVHP